MLRTAGTRLVAGRDIEWTDVYDDRPVAMVSENLARELWDSPEAALGKRIATALAAGEGGSGARSSASCRTCATTA